jgi:hypothetical protein
MKNPLNPTILTGIELTYSNLHSFKAHSLVSFDTCTCEQIHHPKKLPKSFLSPIPCCVLPPSCCVPVPSEDYESALCHNKLV